MGDGRLNERDPADLRGSGIAPTRMPVGQVGGRPESVAYDDGAILVGFTGGTLAKINPSNPSSPATIWTQEVGFIDNGRPEHRVDGWRSARSSGSAATALKRCDEELTPGETRSPELFPMSLGALPRAWAFRGHLLLNQRLGGEVTQLSESFDGTRRPRRIRRTRSGGEPGRSGSMPIPGGRSHPQSRTVLASMTQP